MERSYPVWPIDRSGALAKALRADDSRAFANHHQLVGPNIRYALVPAIGYLQRIKDEEIRTGLKVCGARGHAGRVRWRIDPAVGGSCYASFAAPTLPVMW